MAAGGVPAAQVRRGAPGGGGRGGVSPIMEPMPHFAPASRSAVFPLVATWRVTEPRMNRVCNVSKLPRPPKSERASHRLDPGTRGDNKFPLQLLNSSCLKGVTVGKSTLPIHPLDDTIRVTTLARAVGVPQRWLPLDERHCPGCGAALQRKRVRFQRMTDKSWAGRRGSKEGRTFPSRQTRTTCRAGVILDREC